MEILVILIVLIIIVAIWVAIRGDEIANFLSVIALGWAGIYIICQQERIEVKENFESVIPDRLQDIYYFENTLSDTKYRNKDAFPEDTDGKGPVLGPYWAIDNKDVMEDTLAYSRGVYAYDPVKKRIGTYNAEALDNDDGLARRQEFRGSLNKRAVEGMSRNTRNIFDKSFTAELAEEQSHPWWGGERIGENERYSY